MLAQGMNGSMVQELGKRLHRASLFILLWYQELILGMLYH